ncbi:MAG: YfhO family protein [Oscillospiraceae bacterium]|jgi:uncharacterized membrane protein YfhO|nr:YfhO family protein [Oscillospiraceae bacterium]
MNRVFNFIACHYKRILFAIGVAIASLALGLVWAGAFPLPQEEDYKPFYPVLCAVIIGLLGGLLTVWGLIGRRLKANTCFYTVAAAVLAFACMAIPYMDFGIYPFGEKTVLLIDMYHQYTGFFIDLKHRIFEGGSLLYAGEYGMGSNYILLFSYYLSSPLSLIAILFPENHMTEAMLLLELLKCALSACFFSIFMRGVFKRNDWTCVAFSLMYALSAFSLAYCWNIMWTDCVALLPLIALGLHKLINEGKYALYCIGLGLALISSFYLGFMLCLGLVLYFLIVTLEQKQSLKSFLKKAGRFALGSLVGGGLAMCLILPTYFAMKGTTSSGGELPEIWSNQMTLIEMLSRHYFAIPSAIYVFELPNLYCGLLSLVLLPIFVLNKGISTRQKLANCGVLGVLAFSVLMNKPFLLWHGLHYPNGLPYRFAFIYVFVLLLIGIKSLRAIKTASQGSIFASAACGAAGLIICEQAELIEDTFRVLCLSLLFIAIYAVSLLVIKSGKRRFAGAALALLVFAALIESGSYASIVLKMTGEKEAFASYDGYYRGYDTRETAVDKVLELDPNREYRAEFASRRTTNDAGIFGLRGMESYASSYPAATLEAMKKLGYYINGVNASDIRTFNTASDSILGLKYIISTQDKPYLEQLNELYKVEGAQETLWIYENPYALPYAYLADARLKGWESSGEAVFTNIADFFYRAAGVEELFTYVSLEDIVAEEMNAEEIVPGRFDFSPQAEEASFTINGRAEKSGILLGYNSDPAVKGLQASVKGLDIGDCIEDDRVINLGLCEAGDELSLKGRTTGASNAYIRLAILDTEKLAQGVQILREQAIKTEVFKPSKIKGTVTAKQGQILFTSVPYDKGWHIKIDGKRVKPLVLGGAWIGLEVTEGKHTIEMSFVPEGLIFGIVLSILSLLALVFIIRRKRVEK